MCLGGIKGVLINKSRLAFAGLLLYLSGIIISYPNSGLGYIPFVLFPVSRKLTLTGKGTGRMNFPFGRLFSIRNSFFKLG